MFIYHCLYDLEKVFMRFFCSLSLTHTFRLSFHSNFFRVLSFINSMPISMPYNVYFTPYHQRHVYSNFIRLRRQCVTYAPLHTHASTNLLIFTIVDRKRFPNIYELRENDKTSEKDNFYISPINLLRLLFIKRFDLKYFIAQCEKLWWQKVQVAHIERFLDFNIV